MCYPTFIQKQIIVRESTPPKPVGYISGSGEVGLHQLLSQCGRKQLKSTGKSERCMVRRLRRRSVGCVSCPALSRSGEAKRVGFCENVPFSESAIFWLGKIVV